MSNQHATPYGLRPDTVIALIARGAVLRDALERASSLDEREVIKAKNAFDDALAEAEQQKHLHECERDAP